MNNDKEKIIYTEDLKALEETIEFVRKFDFSNKENSNVETSGNKKVA